MHRLGIHSNLAVIVACTHGIAAVYYRHLLVGAAGSRAELSSEGSGEVCQDDGCEWVDECRG
jgi:hypothetical protein